MKDTLKKKLFILYIYNAVSFKDVHHSLVMDCVKQ